MSNSKLIYRTHRKIVHRGQSWVKEDLNYKITEEQYGRLLMEFNPDVMLRREANVMLQQEKKFHAIRKQGNKSSDETFCDYFEHIKHIGKGKVKKKQKKKKAKGGRTPSPYNSNGYKYKWIRIISTPM